MKSEAKKKTPHKLRTAPCCLSKRDAQNKKKNSGGREGRLDGRLRVKYSHVYSRLSFASRSMYWGSSGGCLQFTSYVQLVQISLLKQS